MRTKIIKYLTLEQYNKKYRNCKHNLLVINRSDIEKFDKEHDKQSINENKNYVLDGRCWALIGNTYYEIPKAPRWTWFRNLKTSTQALTWTILGLGSAAAITIPTVLTVLEANSYVSIMKYDIRSMSDFKKNMEIITPPENKDCAIVAKIDDPSKGGAIANKALSDGYFSLVQKNLDYFKQDLFYGFSLTITDYKDNGIFIPLVGTLSNLNGGLNAKIENVEILKDQLLDDQPDLLMCSFTITYNAEINADFTFLDDSEIHISSNLKGQLEFHNLYLRVDAEIKDAEHNKWENFTIDIWGSEHLTKSGTLVTQLLSTAEGKTSVSNKGESSCTEYLRNKSNVIKYNGNDSWLEYDIEDVYKDPIAILVGTFGKVPSYSCQSLSMQIVWTK